MTAIPPWNARRLVRAVAASICAERTDDRDEPCRDCWQEARELMQLACQELPPDHIFTAEELAEAVSRSTADA